MDIVINKKSETKKDNSNVKFAILAVFIILVLSAVITPIVLQNDTFYTVKIGEKILENGIDMKDSFSWHDLSYTYPHWLYDVITYLIYNAFGWLGVYIATAILSCILGLTIYITNKKLTKNQLTSLILTIGVMYLGKNYIAARAQLPTFILFVLTIYYIEKFLETKKTGYAIGLVVIPILIANLHVAVWPFYFILFLPYIAEYLICEFIDLELFIRVRIIWHMIDLKLAKREKNQDRIKSIEEKLEKEREKLLKANQLRIKRRENPYKIEMSKNKNVKFLIIIMIVCALTGFLTPLGTTPYTYLVKTMNGNTTQNINEHLPMTLINQKDILCIIAFFIAFLMVTDVKIRLNDLLLISGLIFLLLMSRRQVSMFLFVGVLVINRIINYFINKYDKENTKKAIKAMISLPGKIIIISLLVLVCYKIVIPKVKNNETFVDEKVYPSEASEYILENLDLGEVKFFNEYNYGSYMLYKGIPVFIDSRADLYAPEFNKGKDIFNDYIKTVGLNVFYENTFNDYGITHVILHKNAKLNLFLTADTRYKEIYKDDYFVIHERSEYKQESSE